MAQTFQRFDIVGKSQSINLGLPTEILYFQIHHDRVLLKHEIDPFRLRIPKRLLHPTAGAQEKRGKV